MNCNAITVSNEIIKVAKEDGAFITPLKIQRLVTKTILRPPHE